MTTFDRGYARPVDGKRYGILNNEAGTRFYHRAVAPKARNRRKKSRRNTNRSKRRNR